MYIEDEYTELKIELTKDIKKEIIAFANTKGGKIYIGIDDNGNIVGLKKAKEDIESLSGMIREGIRSDLTLYTSIILKNLVVTFWRRKFKADLGLIFPLENWPHTLYKSYLFWIIELSDINYNML